MCKSLRLWNNDTSLASDAVRGDLVRILTKLLKKKKKSGYDGIIIETTGLADPAPVAQTFFVDVRCLAVQPCKLTCTFADATGPLYCCCLAPIVCDCALVQSKGDGSNFQKYPDVCSRGTSHECLSVAQLS